jgi:hypothetical protein
VGSKADMALYKERVLPVLNDWESEVGKIIKRKKHIASSIKRATIKYGY